MTKKKLSQYFRQKKEKRATVTFSRENRDSSTIESFFSCENIQYNIVAKSFERDKKVTHGWGIMNNNDLL